MINYKLTDSMGFIGYRVGDDGSVWSSWKMVSLGGRRGTKQVKSDEWYPVSTPPDGLGYAHVSIRHVNGSGRVRQKTIRVHTLVLTLFVGLCPAGMEACHDPDNDRKNSRLSNLRWGTRQSNMDDQLKHGTRARGTKKASSKLTEEDVREIRGRVRNGEKVS